MNLDELTRKAEAATPGPWERQGSYGVVAPTAPSAGDPEILGRNICGMWDGCQTSDDMEANATFIAAARNHWDALLAAARAAEALVEFLQTGHVRKDGWSDEDTGEWHELPDSMVYPLVGRNSEKVQDLVAALRELREAS